MDGALSSVPSQSYVTLEAAGSHKVIIPARAAERSRVLAYLYKGLLVMDCHRRQSLQSSSPMPCSSTHTIGEATAGLASKRWREEDDNEESGSEESEYVSFACRESVGHAAALQDVVVPLHTLTPEALSRVSQYLMMDSPDGMRALYGMRPDSQEDIQRVTEIVRAADFLQC